MYVRVFIMYGYVYVRRFKTYGRNLLELWRRGSSGAQNASKLKAMEINLLDYYNI
jgi:hypothetical protein